MLRKEQIEFYVKRDRDCDDPRRLTFPILTADGQEAATDMLFAGRNHTGDKLDLIEAFWEPAKPGVCRVYAVWRVAESKAMLVYRGEAIDCARGNADLKPVLDRR